MPKCVLYIPSLGQTIDPLRDWVFEHFDHPDYDCTIAKVPHHTSLEAALGAAYVDFMQRTDSPEDVFLKIDDDMLPHPDMMQVLDEIRGLHLVGVPYLSRNTYQDDGSPGIFPMIFKRAPDGGYNAYNPAGVEAGPLEVDAFGGGVIFATRELLSKLQAPFMARWDDQTGERTRGQDLLFIEKAQGAGYRAYCDLRFPAGHRKHLNLSDIGPGPLEPWNPHGGPQRHPEQPIFVGGCPRSGTTLLRCLLDEHKDIFIGTEIKVLPGLLEQYRAAHRLLGDATGRWGLTSQRLRKAWRQLFASLWVPAFEASGKKRFGHKEPTLIGLGDEIFHLWPGAQMICIVRHPIDVCASLLRQEWRDVNHKADRLSYTKDIDAACNLWCKATEVILSLLDRYSGQVAVVKYEAIVQDPAQCCRGLCSILGEEYDPGMLDFWRRERPVNNSNREAIKKPVYLDSIGRGYGELDAEQQWVVAETCGEQMKLFGYEVRSSGSVV